jgi:hypothetical protein
VAAEGAREFPENKVEKSGMFSAPQKMASYSPRLPHVSPHLHHTFTIQKHGGNRKPPVKTPFHSEIFFMQKP